MKKNDIIQLEIKERLFPNKGVGMYEGQKIIVKNALPGQIIEARIIKKRNDKMEAQSLQVIKPACYEIEPKCSHFVLCGGCAYQNLDYEKELVLKETQVKKLLEQSQIEGYCYEGIVPSPNETGYRNKCEFSFGDEQKGGALSLGMRKRQSFYEVVTLKDCNIIDSDYLKIIQCTLDFFQKRNIPFYHKMRHDGQLRHLVVRKGAKTKELLVNIVTTSQITFSLEELKDALLNIKLEGKICGLLHTINDTLGDAVKSDHTKIVYGRDYFVEKLFHLEFKISAFSFFQTNSKGAEKLYSVVKDFIGDAHDKVIFDLYCGTGTITQIVSEKAKSVIGIEIVEEAIISAIENAKRNHITNCSFIAGDVLKKVDELSEKPDIIIVDPPRDGIHPKAVQKIIDFGPDSIVYVSCKPTSLVRDLKLFEQGGYCIERIKLVDMFPRTVHVETVVMLRNCGWKKK